MEVCNRWLQPHGRNAPSHWAGRTLNLVSLACARSGTTLLKKALFWTLAGGASCVLLMLVSTWLWSPSLDTTVEVEYATGRELKAAGMVERGWVPAWIPDEAIDVHEIHDVDNNLSAFAFRLPAGPQWTLPVDCQQASGAMFIRSRFEAEWMPGDRPDLRYFQCDAWTPLAVRRLHAVATSRDGSQFFGWTSPMK